MKAAVVAVHPDEVQAEDEARDPTTPHLRRAPRSRPCSCLSITEPRIEANGVMPIPDMALWPSSQCTLQNLVSSQSYKSIRNSKAAYVGRMSLL